MDKNRTYQRGDVFLADLDPSFGSEQGGTRPVVILQNNIGNFHSPTLIVAPVTSNTGKKTNFPTHCRIEGRDGLFLPSVVMLEQITTIDKHRLKGYLCRLNNEEMRDIDRAMEISLGLREIAKGPHKGRTAMKLTRRDRFNGSGCLDMTAYLAMKNIEREDASMEGRL